MMTNTPWKVVDFTLSDMTTLRLTDDVAVNAYKVTETLTVDGKAVTLEAADSSTSDHKMNVALRGTHESVTGDPYGRDRAAKSR